MTAEVEKKKLNLELTPLERDILIEMSVGDQTIFIERYGQENMAVHLNGSELDLPTVMGMCQKRWLCYRPNPHRYRMTSKGSRIIETRLKIFR